MTMTDPNAFGIAGLLGWPVAHSRSPVIHNHWLAHYGIAGRYVLFPVPPENLPAAVRGLAALGLRGCNVTTPHKQAIMPLLDRVDDLARRIGAVNTVVVEKDGTLTGFNNDGNGFVQSLRDADAKWKPDAGPIAVLGAGGAARPGPHWPRAHAIRLVTERSSARRKSRTPAAGNGALGTTRRCARRRTARERDECRHGGETEFR
jgi:shikimate dehydrogenase